MRRSVVLVTLFALLAPSCRSDEIELSYEYEAGDSLSYTMTATEKIESLADGAIVTVVMEPVEVEEDGLPSPGTEDRTFKLRIGQSGEVLEVLEVDGVPASALDQEQLSLIGTYRPPLPLDPVGLDDT